MARLMAIDYGSKRVGVAVTDPLKIIATGLTTVHAKDIIKFLQNYFSKETVECIVVGEPKQLNNQVSSSAVSVEKFIKELKKYFPKLLIERMDERFTSQIALQTMIDSGLKKKSRQNKALVDEISATLILQSYLGKIINNKS